MTLNIAMTLLFVKCKCKRKQRKTSLGWPKICLCTGLGSPKTFTLTFAIEFAIAIRICNCNCEFNCKFSCKSQCKCHSTWLRMANPCLFLLDQAQDGQFVQGWPIRQGAVECQVEKWLQLNYDYGAVSQRIFTKLLGHLEMQSGQEILFFQALRATFRAFLRGIPEVSENN